MMGMFMIEFAFLNHIKSCLYSKKMTILITYSSMKHGKCPSTTFNIMKVNGDMDIKLHNDQKSIVKTSCIIYSSVLYCITMLCL